jgi:hypothetical protein
MKNIKKFYPLFLSLIFFFTAVFFWDKIKISYNESNLIIGPGQYFEKKFNPYSQLIRFFFLIIIPSIIYIFSFLFFNKNTFKINYKNKHYFLTEKEINLKDSSFNFITYFFIIYISLEFLLLDFNKFISVEFYHDGSFLIPPLNFINSKKIFASNYYDYGLIGNNLGLISYFFFDYYNPGTIILTKLILIYSIKLSLIFISVKLISYLEFKNTEKKLFFLIFTFIIINLPDYFDHYQYFHFRTALYFLFILLLGSGICEKNYLGIKFFSIGAFSLISFLWWWDIGVYINGIIFLLTIYLFIHKKKKELFFLFLGTVSIWLLFFLLLPQNEIYEFFFQFKSIYFNSAYLLGIEYPRPFSEKSLKYTKALIIIYVTSLLIININFSKKINANYKFKIYLNLIFICSIFNFNSALIRSDVAHIRYSSGLYITLFIFLIMFYFFYAIRNKYNKLFTFFLEKKKFNFFLFTTHILFILFLFFFNLNNNQKVSLQKISRIENIKSNLYNLISADNEIFIKNEHLQSLSGSTFNYVDVLNKYILISKNDKCSQVIISEDISFPYFLEKPSCTQFFNPSRSVFVNSTENKFIEQLKSSSPQILLYEGPIKFLGNKSNMPNAIKYIEENYFFLENYKGFIFYKKKNL